MQHGRITQSHGEPEEYTQTLHLKHIKHELGALIRSNTRLKKQLRGYKALLEALEDALDRQHDDLNSLLKTFKGVGTANGATQKTGTTNGSVRHHIVNGRSVMP